MASALNAFMKIGKAEGEARQGMYGKEKWIELQSWEWDGRGRNELDQGRRRGRRQAFAPTR